MFLLDPKKYTFRAGHQQGQNVETNGGKEGSVASPTVSFGQANASFGARLCEWDDDDSDVKSMTLHCRILK